MMNLVYVARSQAHTSLKIEREKLESKLQEFLIKEPEWTSKMSTLDSQLASTHDRLSKIEAERNHLSQENVLLQQQSKKVEGAIKDLREELAQANSAMTTTTRQMQHTQTELKNALRRAEDAENIQKSLQSEGTNLMRSLDEMRPKIVELTGVKLDLSEKMDSLERALKSRDLTIAQLENELGEVRDNLEHSDKIWKDKVAHQEKRLVDGMNGTADMQKAYDELQEELDTALASLRNLETQRANHPQELRRHLEEIEHFSHLSQSQAEELDTLKHELVVAKKAHVCAVK
jgi:chromosome segregation ATPase